MSKDVRIYKVRLRRQAAWANVPKEFCLIATDAADAGRAATVYCDTLNAELAPDVASQEPWYLDRLLAMAHAAKMTPDALNALSEDVL